MDEDRVEGAAESQCANVASDVLALRVELATYQEHPRREIHQGHREVRLEVEGAVSAAGTELEHSERCRPGRLAEDANDVSRFAAGFLRIPEDRPPFRQLVVERHTLYS